MSVASNIAMSLLFSIPLQYQNLTQSTLHNLFPCEFQGKDFYSKHIKSPVGILGGFEELWCGELKSQRTKTAPDEKTHLSVWPILNLKSYLFL